MGIPARSSCSGMREPRPARAHASAAPPIATPPPAPTVTPQPAAHLDYGVHMFIANQPATTERDLHMAVDGGFHWQKSLFEWREIEGAAKGQFDWSDADRVVRASNAAGLKIIARLDFEPMWARADHAHNGPPDNYQDYWDFVSGVRDALSQSDQPSGACTPSRCGTSRTWIASGAIRRSTPIRPPTTCVCCDGAYRAAHAADPDIVVISAGLSPSGVTDGHSADDVQYLKWMYAAGLAGKYDVLGVHANTQAPDPAAPLGSLKLFPDAELLLPTRRAVAPGDGRQRRRRQAGVADRVGLDRGHGPPRIRVVRGQRGQEGRATSSPRSSTPAITGRHGSASCASGRCPTRRGTQAARNTGGRSPIPMARRGRRTR